jgi:hypothetical protein
MKIWIAVFFVLICSSASLAREILSRPDGEDIITIPFRISESIAKIPCIEVIINGKKVWAGLDTGLTELGAMKQSVADKLGIKYDKKSKQNINNSGFGFLSEKYPMHFVSTSDIEFDDSTFCIIPDNMMPLPDIHITENKKMEILINFGSLYRNSRVQFDYLQNVVRIFSFDKSFNSSKCIISDYEYLDALSFITIKNEDEKDFQVMLDTGSSINFLLTDFDKIAYQQGKTGSAALPGIKITGRNSKTKIIIDNRKFYNIDVFLAKKDKRLHSSLGYPFFKDKVFTLDYKAKKVYIETDG